MRQFTKKSVTRRYFLYYTPEEDFSTIQEFFLKVDGFGL